MSITGLPLFHIITFLIGQDPQPHLTYHFCWNFELLRVGVVLNLYKHNFSSRRWVFLNVSLPELQELVGSNIHESCFDTNLFRVKIFGNRMFTGLNSFSNLPQYDDFVPWICQYEICSIHKLKFVGPKFFNVTCLFRLSWKCPGHVWDMSRGQGHVLKSQGQNQMAGHIFSIFWSVMCPSCVLRVSHVSDTLKKTKKMRKQINQIFQIAFGRIIRFHCKFFLKFFFCIYKTITDSKVEKMEVTTKGLLCEHKNALRSKSLLPPLVPLLILDKLIFFIFSFFINIWSHKNKLQEMVHLVNNSILNLF